MGMDDLRCGLRRHVRHSEPALTNVPREIIKPSAKRVLVWFGPGNLQPYTVLAHSNVVLFNGYTLYPNQPAGGVGASTIVTPAHEFRIEDWGEIVQGPWYGISNALGTNGHTMEVFDDSMEFEFLLQQHALKIRGK